MAKTDTANPTVSKADELDELLGGSGAPGDGELDTILNSAGAAPSSEEVDVNFGNTVLSDAVERDFRAMPNEWWLGEIVEAFGTRSKAGNLQIEFLFQRCDGGEFDGVTVSDWALIDPRQPKSHWKIKKIAKRVGLLGPDGQLTAKSPKEFVGRKLMLQNKLDTEYDPTSPRNKVFDYAPAQAAAG